MTPRDLLSVPHTLLLSFPDKIVHVSGGEELTVKASAATTSLSNVRFEVVGYTKLTLVGTEITMTGIARSVRCCLSALCIPYYTASCCTHTALCFTIRVYTR